MWMSGYNTGGTGVETGYEARVNCRTKSIVKLANCFVHLKSRYQISAVADFRLASVFVDYFKKWKRIETHYVEPSAFADRDLL